LLAICVIQPISELPETLPTCFFGLCLPLLDRWHACISRVLAAKEARYQVDGELILDVEVGDGFAVIESPGIADEALLGDWNAEYFLDGMPKVFDWACWVDLNGDSAAD
jgi:hypothetical protein